MRSRTAINGFISIIKVLKYSQINGKIYIIYHRTNGADMNILKEIITNHVLIVPIIAWAISQTLKVFTNLFVVKELDIKRILADGGMPSSHSATVVSLAVMCGWTAGFNSAIFALALLFAIVVMRDAVGVRRDTGRNAAKLRELADAVNKSFLSKDKEIRTENLKVLVGHTPLQVVFGVLIGLSVSILYIVIFLA